MTVEDLDPDSGRPSKSPTAFRTISEVAEELGVQPHVLRFWESKFPQVRPLKRAGGRRYYRPEDVEALRTIRSLLHEQGYTIKGAQKVLRARRRAEATAVVEEGERTRNANPMAEDAALRRALAELAQELRQAAERLARLLAG
ncbi:HTH-type transcriptional repressor CarH [bacterium HR40]|nr:HTH-type transcriptional repressor CarH [bacterium HR40]